MLIFIEAYGVAVKTCKYYSCATLLVYESMWFLSIVNLAYTLMSTWSIEEYIRELQDMPHCKPVFFVSIAKLLYVLTCGLACFLHWIKNTFVHISLCQSRFFGVSRASQFVSKRQVISLHFPLTARSKENSKRLQSSVVLVHRIFFADNLCRIVIDPDCS